MGLILNGDKGIEYSNLNQDIKSLLLPKNWIINGMFDVWQRGISHTAIGYGSVDRWFLYHQTSTQTLSRQTFGLGQTDVPNNPTYYCRSIVSSGNTAGSRAIVEQYIEDVTKLATKTISVSFWAKADSNKNIAIEMSQVFGSGGSSPVASIGVQKFAVTSTWKRFTKTITLPSVAGKTLGTGHYVKLIIWFDGGSDFNSRTGSLGNQSGTFDIANVSLVEGSVAVECQNQPYADVLRDCQRYYQQFKSESGARYIGSSGFAWSTTNTGQLISLPVELRSIPNATLDITGTVSLVSPSGVGFTINSLGISVSESLRTQVLLSATSSGLTVGTVYFLRLSSGASIGISAEL